MTKLADELERLIKLEANAPTFAQIEVAQMNLSSWMIGQASTILSALKAQEAPADVIEALRAFADPEGRIALPMLDPDGNELGTAWNTPEEILRVAVFEDEGGTVWSPPTAWAYFSVCRARDVKDALITRLSADLAEAGKVTGEARLQLEYLDERFPTGTTPAVVARLIGWQSRGGVSV